MYAVGMSNPIFLDRHGLWSDIQKYRFEQFGQLSERAGQGSARKRQGPCFHLAHDPAPLSFCRVPDPLPYGVDAGLAPLAGEAGCFIDGAGVPDHLHRDTERLLQEIPVATRADADGRWKDVLDVYFQHCVSLLWPALHALIDWTQAPVFLDKELKGLMPGRRRNRRYVDKLLAVRLRSVCITSMAPLGGNFLSLNYSLPMLHLQSWLGREDELAAQARQNPFALFMQVELEAARQAAPADRLQRKVRLLRQLYAHGYDKADFHRLFAFLDNAMALPPVLELQFVQVSNQIETQGVSDMAYMTSIERVAIGRGRLEGRAAGRVEGKVEGRVEGMREAVHCLLEQRFGSLSENDLEQLVGLDQAALQDCLIHVLNTRSLEELLRRH
ncbi:hypothetical protein NJI34_44015 [Pseudomonas sp. S 311-6]|uniref:hypothetical protein n=1 Tax=Kerstersia gyiorum TaxID=206506 RepID=UPI002097EEC3|nr:hypothetical protein [Pseudomonas sp. S 311-6]